MPITDRDKRTLIIGGSVAGFLLVAFLIYKVFLSGGGAAPTASPSLVLSPVPTGSETPSSSQTPGVPGVVTFAGHDPYCMPQSYVSRLVLLHIPLPDTDYVCPGVIVPSSSPSVTPTPSGSGSPSSSPSVPSAPIASSVTVGGKTVVLMTVPASPPGTRAQVEVNGKVYNVAVGATFAAGTFQLQGVSGPCASFLYGDQAFSLCDA